MADFKVGDIITGIKGVGIYGLTNSNSVMKVIALLDPNSYGGDDLKVQIIDTSLNKECIGEEYSVKSKFFILYDYNIFKNIAKKLGNKINELRDSPFKTELIKTMKEG